MKKAINIIAGAALLVAAFGTASATTAAEPRIAAEPVATIVVQSRDGQNRRVRIHNQTGWTMTHFYASDSRVDDWQEDMLGSSVLANGSSITMNIDDGNGGCLYDFKARFTNGQELTRMRINVCQIADYYYTR
ncbi:hypothetical protein [Brevundimonas sp.]|uniref:hypothetical protein n=1 Tax=Brevundimonas sp. TaxID=1871086 RepID=UPI003F72C4EE